MPHCPSDDEIVLGSSELIQTFLDQLEEDLISYESTLISLPSDIEDSKKVSEELLRKIHSNKGSAAAMGYSVIGQALHQMEDYLFSWKKSGKGLNTEDLLSLIDFQRQVVDLSRQDDLSRNEYLSKYQNLRLDLTNRESGTTSISVLMVDGFQATSLLLSSKIDRDISIKSCSDGYQALGRLLHEKYHVIVCGGKTFGLDGIAVLSAIKFNEATKHIKTVLLTSSKNNSGINPDLVVGRNEEEIERFCLWLKDLKASKIAS